MIYALLHPLIFDFYQVPVFYGPSSQYYYVVNHKINWKVVLEMSLSNCQPEFSAVKILCLVQSFVLWTKYRQPGESYLQTTIAS